MSTRSNADQICHQNLLTITEEITATEEEKLLLLREYYEARLSSTLSFSEAAKTILSLYHTRREREKEKKVYRSDIVKEKELVSTLLAERYVFQGPILREELHTFEGEAGIACWSSNRYSSLAYERFASLFSRGQPIHAESFTDVCEQISVGKCEFGILPIENSVDGRLVGFYRMLDKYELKIVAVCSVEDEEIEKLTRFALVSRTLCHFDGDHPRWIEVSATSANAKKLLDIIFIAERFEMNVTRLSSIPLYYRGNVCVDTVTLALSEKNALLFYMYLYLFGKDINILGLFIQI